MTQSEHYANRKPSLVVVADDGRDGKNPNARTYTTRSTASHAARLWPADR